MAAAAAYRDILFDCPGHSDSLHMLGVIAQQGGDAEAALEYFRRAVEIVPSNAQFLNNLGVSARANGRSDGNHTFAREEFDASRSR